MRKIIDRPRPLRPLVLPILPLPLLTPLLMALLLVLSTSLIAWAAGEMTECQVQVEIVGQVLDEALEPLADQEITILLDAGDDDWAEEYQVVTNRQGVFHFQERVTQTSYLNAGYQCVKIQAAISFADDVERFAYKAGWPAEADEAGATERWLADGSYRNGYQVLFYHLRREHQEDREPESQPEFADLTIGLGSRDDPCLFQLTRNFTVTEHYLDEQGQSLQGAASTVSTGRELFWGDPPPEIEREGKTYQYLGWTLDEERAPTLELRPEAAVVDVQDHHQVYYYYREQNLTELKVRHINATDGRPLAEPEQYWIAIAETPHFLSRSQELIPLVPLRVELFTATKSTTARTFATGGTEIGALGKILAEARRGSPITEVTVDIQPGMMELVYYYHPDQDGDGVPDFGITERFSLTDGSDVGLADETVLYANLDPYEGIPPDVSGYTYVGYRRESGGQPDPDPDRPDDFHTGRPQFAVQAEGLITYLYEFADDSGSSGGGKKPGGNGGGGNSGGEEATKPPNPETPTEEPSPPAEEHKPEEPLPPEIPDQPEPEKESSPNEEAEPAVDKPEPKSIENTSSQKVAAYPVLDEAEREALRNVTFVKRGHTQEAQPGEEVSYSFSGFENAFPYPLEEFTIVDRPDQGLDFVSLHLPAFQQGAGVTYQVSCTSNRRGEWVLSNGFPADRPQTVTAPPLAEGEYITEIAVYLGEVPSGFGVGDQLEITFRIWSEPPAEELHNRGGLLYRDAGELVSSQSADTNPALTVASFFNRGSGGGSFGSDGDGADLLATVSNRTGANWLVNVMLLVLALCLLALAKHTKRRRA